MWFAVNKTFCNPLNFLSKLSFHFTSILAILHLIFPKRVLRYWLQFQPPLDLSLTHEMEVYCNGACHRYNSKTTRRICLTFRKTLFFYGKRGNGNFLGREFTFFSLFSRKLRTTLLLILSKQSSVLLIISPKKNYFETIFSECCI